MRAEKHPIHMKFIGEVKESQISVVENFFRMTTEAIMKPQCLERQ